MNEQIIFRTGFDTKPFDRAMRSMNQMAAATSKAINDSFKKAAQNFGAIFSVAGLTSMANKLANMADEVKGASEAFGVGTNFIQGWRTAVSQNSGTVAQANKGIEKLSLLLGEGSENFAKWGIATKHANGVAKTTDEVMFAIADKMKATSSGTERAAMAFDLLGKSGASLIPTLMMGGEALNKYINAAYKLSPEEIEAVAQAQDDLKLAIDRLTIGLGHGVGWTIKLAQSFGILSSNAKATMADLDELRGKAGWWDNLAGGTLGKSLTAMIPGGLALAKKAQDLGTASVVADRQNQKNIPTMTSTVSSTSKANQFKEEIKKLTTGTAVLNFSTGVPYDKKAAGDKVDAFYGEYKGKLGTQREELKAAMDKENKGSFKWYKAKAALDENAKAHWLLKSDAQKMMDDSQRPGGMSKISDGMRRGNSREESGNSEMSLGDTLKKLSKLTDLAEGSGINIIPKNGK